MLRLLSWNVGGHYALKLADSAETGAAALQMIDIAVIQETFLLPGQEESLPIPSGYRVYAKSRPQYSHRLPGGGVLAIVHSSLRCDVCESVSAPDLLVLDFHTWFLIAAYVPPTTSRWMRWTDVDPVQRLQEAVAYCTSNPLKTLLCVGDFNSRTGNHTPHPRWQRASTDREVNARGRWLLHLCQQQQLQILNGTEFDTHRPARHTSSQPQGVSVIDYILYSIQSLHAFAKPQLAVGDVPDGYDHAPLFLSFPAPSDPLPPYPPTDNVLTCRFARSLKQCPLLNRV